MNKCKQVKTNQVQKGWWLLVKILTQGKFKLWLISELYQELPSNKTAECVFFCKFCWPYLKQQTIILWCTNKRFRQVREKSGKNKNFLRSGKIFDIVKVSEKSGNSVFLFIIHNFSSRLWNAFSFGKDEKYAGKAINLTLCARHL